MRINDDLTRPVIVHAGRLDWVKSPAAGVDRRMLYRVGDEVARATSIVRYAPGSAFPRHVHSGGEEILVLEGTFQDEHGDYPAGSYFRNPPGTSHEPAAAQGCTIFVRLWQFREGDDRQIVRQPGEGEPAPLRDGAISARTLFAMARSVCHRGLAGQRHRNRREPARAGVHPFVGRRQREWRGTGSAKLGPASRRSDAGSDGRAAGRADLVQGRAAPA